MDQDPVVAIERHDIGHRTQCNQIQIVGHVGCRQTPFGEPSALAQVTAQAQQHVEDHSDTGQRLGREGTAGQVRVDQGVRRRQFFTGQVVIGDDHLPTQCPRRAAATPSLLDTPLSTVTMTSGSKRRA